PGATRYVMTTLIIEVNSNVDQQKGFDFLKEKSYPIKDWLTIYFAGLTLEDIQGDKNLKKIQNCVCEMLNEKLFPNTTPQIQHILFKEFAIQ
ncbi:MAG: flagellar basal body-associated FliL family protein, partial [Planctomycetes bacterium]|nr:flagellar basal body-associated FliL family protein [Planctomycetota bacterium]